MLFCYLMQLSPHLTFEHDNDSFSCVCVFALTLTALCVHQGCDSLLTRLTQPFGVPGWVEVHQPLSTDNRGDGKQENAGNLILTSKQGRTLVRASCLSLSLSLHFLGMYTSPPPNPPPLAARSTLSPIEDRLVDPVGGDTGGGREGGRSGVGGGKRSQSGDSFLLVVLEAHGTLQEHNVTHKAPGGARMAIKWIALTQSGERRRGEDSAGCRGHADRIIREEKKSVTFTSLDHSGF